RFHTMAHEDAPVVTRLRDAGAIIVGKTGLHEFAYGVTNANPHAGSVRNPWDRSRTPGGSSGGSAAAVAAGFCAAAVGYATGAGCSRAYRATSAGKNWIPRARRHAGRPWARLPPRAPPFWTW